MAVQLMDLNETDAWNASTPWPEWPPPRAPTKIGLKYSGLFLVFIPVITILGNLLVILSVLRFRALQSAINFLILGLAVADLLVALTVMPYAVYVYVQNGDWYIGNLMCDIYMASDVACSTASILLLAVISFDRYRAVSHPIQYSRQSQNVKRVFAMIAIIWFISLALASPIVFGVNVRPPDANELECRFYNAEFSIGSSIISFVIPCFLVLFVYIRIIIALKKREKAAKLRREKNSTAQGFGMGNGSTPAEEDAAGRIVAGPVVNVMMAALPAMTRHMRRFERHRRAIELAGEDDEFGARGAGGGGGRSGVADAAAPLAPPPPQPATAATTSADEDDDDEYEFDDDDDEYDGDDVAPESGITVAGDESSRGGSSLMAVATVCTPLPVLPSAGMLRRILSAASPKHVKSSSFYYSSSSSSTQPAPLQEHEFGVSLTPRSSIDSLSQDAHVVTNDFVSENCTTASRRSSLADESLPTSSLNSSADSRPAKKFKNLSRNYSTRHHRKSVGHHGSSRSASFSHRPGNEAIIPSIIRTISRRSPKLFRRDKSGDERPSMVLANPSTVTPGRSARPVRQLTSQTETETISASRDVPPMNFSRSTTANSAELLASPEATFPALLSESVPEEAQSTRDTDDSHPTVSFALTVREMDGTALNQLKGCSDMTRRVSSADAPLAVKILTRPSLPNLARMDSLGSSQTRADSLKSVDSKQSLKKNAKNGIAVKLVKRAMKHEHSLKRKVSKAQRKEKRATKTLGVVVGVFLICWVPFFAINILNAVCILLNEEFCQVGFDLFFYCTWIGYMNSFMNPIIYTIFNTEFRRAFKSLIFGRNVHRGHMMSKQVHL